MFTSIPLLTRRHNWIQFERILLPWASISCCQTNVWSDSINSSSCLSHSAVGGRIGYIGGTCPCFFSPCYLQLSISFWGVKKGKEIPSLLYACKQEGILSFEVQWLFLTLWWFSKMMAVSFCRRNTFVHLIASCFLHSSFEVAVVIVLVLKPETSGGTDLLFEINFHWQNKSVSPDHSDFSVAIYPHKRGPHLA